MSFSLYSKETKLFLTCLGGGWPGWGDAGRSDPAGAPLSPYLLSFSSPVPWGQEPAQRGRSKQQSMRRSPPPRGPSAQWVLRRAALLFLPRDPFTGAAKGSFKNTVIQPGSQCLKDLLCAGAGAEASFLPHGRRARGPALVGGGEDLESKGASSTSPVRALRQGREASRLLRLPVEGTPYPVGIGSIHWPSLPPPRHRPFQLISQPDALDGP